MTTIPLYERTEQGIQVISDRKHGDVRIPNYVYDLWMPLLGATTIGVYSMYCRLEHDGLIKGLSVQKIATACRIGKDRLADIHEALERYGFITIKRPEGVERVMHWTLTVIVHEPPENVDMEWVKKNAPDDLPADYQPLTPWLAKSQTEPLADLNGNTENPNKSAILYPEGYTADPNKSAIVDPNRKANIESFIIESFIPSLPSNAIVAETGCTQPEKQKTNPYPKMATPSTVRPLPKIKTEEPGKKKIEVEPLSELEKAINGICQGMSLIHQSNIRKLLKEPVIIDEVTYGSPESLWPDKDFQRYVEERLNWAHSKDNGRSSQKGIVALIRKYETPVFGWLCRTPPVTSVSEIAAKLREQQYREDRNAFWESQK